MSERDPGQTISAHDIIRNGTWTVLDGLPQFGTLVDDACAEIVEAVRALEGSVAAEHLVANGLGLLHQVLPADSIGQLRDRVMTGVRPRLLRVAAAVGREVLGLDDELVVDDYTILRVNYPYEVALQAAQTAENPGIGRVSSNALAAASPRHDPLYAPRAWHGGEPPPAWAHGPHQDTWTGHSLGGVNLWWALEDVPAEAAMVFYPAMFGVPLEPDPTNLYLREGYALPKPHPVALRRGEMVVFNPEMLHGTHLNLSGRTRLALSARINARAPRFSRRCFYAREFWHACHDLDRGDTEAIVRFGRGENLCHPDDEPSSVPPEPWRSERVEAPVQRNDAVVVCDSDDLKPGESLVLMCQDDRLLVARTQAGELYAFDEACPHLGVSLVGGFVDDEFLHCPAHAVAFSLRDGTSSSPLLRLAMQEAWDEDGRVLVRVL